MPGRPAILGENACSLLPHTDVEKFWPHIVMELRKISHVWDMWWTEESLHMAVMSGTMEVWVAGRPPEFKLVFFTQILHFPANSILQVVLMFGTRLRELTPVIAATLEQYAEEHGCRYAEVFGRHGWERILERQGFKRSASVFTKPLGEFRRH